MGKNDNAYMLRRLEKRNPKLYARYRSGEIGAREALIAAGIKSPAKPLNEMKRFWRKASKREQDEFVDWLRSVGFIKPEPVATSSAALRDKAGKLSMETVVRIREMMERSRMNLRDVKKELGVSNNDWTMGHVLDRKSAYPDALMHWETWLRKHET